MKQKNLIPPEIISNRGRSVCLFAAGPMKQKIKKNRHETMMTLKMTLMMALLVKMMMVMMLNGDDEVDSDGTDDGAVNDYIDRERERDKGTMDDYRIVVFEQSLSMELIHFVLYTHTYTFHDSNVGK